MLPNLAGAYRQGYGEATTFGDGPDPVANFSNQVERQRLAKAKKAEEQGKTFQDLLKGLNKLGDAFDNDQISILEETNKFIDQNSRDMAVNPEKYSDPRFQAEISKFGLKQQSRIAQSKQQKQEYEKVLGILQGDKNNIFDLELSYDKLERFAKPQDFPDLAEEVKAAGGVEQWRALNREEYLRPEVRYDYNKHLDAVFKGKQLLGEPVVNSTSYKDKFGKYVYRTDTTIPYNEQAALQAITNIFNSPSAYNQKFIDTQKSIVANNVAFDTDGTPNPDTSSIIGKDIIKTAINLFGAEAVAADPEITLAQASAVREGERYAKEVQKRSEKILGKGGGINIDIGGGAGVKPIELGLVEGVTDNYKIDNAPSQTTAVLSDNTVTMKSNLNYSPEMFDTEGNRLESSGQVEAVYGPYGVYPVYTSGPKKGQRVPDTDLDNIDNYEYAVMGSATIEEGKKFGTLNLQKQKTIWGPDRYFYAARLDKASEAEKKMLQAKRQAMEAEVAAKNEELKKKRQTPATQRAVSGDKEKPEQKRKDVKTKGTGTSTPTKKEETQKKEKKSSPRSNDF